MFDEIIMKEFEKQAMIGLLEHLGIGTIKRGIGSFIKSRPLTSFLRKLPLFGEKVEARTPMIAPASTESIISGVKPKKKSGLGMELLTGGAFAGYSAHLGSQQARQFEPTSGSVEAYKQLFPGYHGGVI